MPPSILCIFSVSIAASTATRRLRFISRFWKHFLLPHRCLKIEEITRALETLGLMVSSYGSLTSVFLFSWISDDVFFLPMLANYWLSILKPWRKYCDCFTKMLQICTVILPLAQCRNIQACAMLWLAMWQSGNCRGARRQHASVRVVWHDR